MERDKTKWVRADFNALFSQLLCLSHEDFRLDFEGRSLELRAGMILTAFDENSKATSATTCSHPELSSPARSGCPAAVHDGCSGWMKTVSVTNPIF
jgi:hypothetical protein